MLSHKGGIYGRPRSFTWKSVRLTNRGPLSAAVIAVCLSGHARALYSPPNGFNIGTPRGAEADGGWKGDPRYCSHFQRLAHSYTIDVAISMAGKLDQKV
jgi:hypothetical protein